VCVGGELEALGGVEAVERLGQAHHALRDEVGQLDAVARVALGDVDHQAHVVLHQQVLGLPLVGQALRGVRRRLGAARRREVGGGLGGGGAPARRRNRLAQPLEGQPLLQDDRQARLLHAGQHAGVAQRRHVGRDVAAAVGPAGAGAGQARG
jgi:hypothetical protein